MGRCRGFSYYFALLVGIFLYSTTLSIPVQFLGGDFRRTGFRRESFVLKTFGGSEELE